MFLFISCISQHHDWRLLGLAVAVCLFSGIVAVHLFKAAKRADRRRTVRIAAAGAIASFGVWATHFIAILAFRPGVEISFDAPLTVLSFLSAATVSSLGFSIALKQGWRFAPPSGAQFSAAALRRCIT
jgi:diguanylate cyclase